MPTAHPKSHWHKVVHHTKSAGRAVRWSIAAVLFILGLGQIPDEVGVWERWIKAVKADPHVHALAVVLAHISSILGLWWVRLALIFLAVIILLWGSRPFWQFRHRALFYLRRTVSEEIWISRENALKILEESRWASVRQGENPWMVGLLSPGLSNRAAMFRHWCIQALNYFRDTYKKAARTVDGKEQFEESALRRYLFEKYEEQVQKAFGDPY